tara:strand:- start:2516 stop:3724 length:1209 start_codon:yes stop_codon:yes gene_type:complete
MKKILFLGASHHQVPSIKYALNAGYWVLTSDNIEQNPGHKLAHKSFNISTLEKEKLLHIAKKEKINGILAPGSDLSMLTCSYIANKLRLPSNSYACIKSLVYKSKFRKLLSQNNLQNIDFKKFDYKNDKGIEKFLKKNEKRYIVKPIDSNGSKGISVLNLNKNFKEKIENAFNVSNTKQIIIEEYLSKKKPQVCGDGYYQDGKIIFIYFGNGHFYNNKNFMAPWGETFPSSHNKEILDIAKNKLELVLQLSGFSRGPFNFDLIITKDNKVFILEIGPRSGGNFIPTVIKKQTGVDMIGAEVEASINKEFRFKPKVTKKNQFFGSYILHSRQYSGKFNKISFLNNINNYIEQITLYKKRGHLIEPFSSADKAIGNIIIKTKTIKKMRSLFDNGLHDYFKIHIF